jgi:hypothetical protein
LHHGCVDEAEGDRSDFVAIAGDTYIATDALGHFLDFGQFAGKGRAVKPAVFFDVKQHHVAIVFGGNMDIRVARVRDDRVEQRAQYGGEPVCIRVHVHTLRYVVNDYALAAHGCRKRAYRQLVDHKVQSNLALRGHCVSCVRIHCIQFLE